VNSGEYERVTPNHEHLEMMIKEETIEEIRKTKRGAEPLGILNMRGMIVLGEILRPVNPQHQRCRAPRGDLKRRKLLPLGIPMRDMRPGCTAGRASSAAGQEFQLQGRYTNGRIEANRLFPALFLDLFVFCVDDVFFRLG
jgi:hypothetical protein